MPVRAVPPRLGSPQQIKDPKDPRHGRHVGHPPSPPWFPLLQAAVEISPVPQKQEEEEEDEAAPGDPRAS